MSGSLFSSERFETQPNKPFRIGRVIVWLIVFGIPVAVLVYLPHLTKPEPTSSDAHQKSLAPASTPAAVPVYQPRTRIDFTKPSSDPYLPGGWSDCEPYQRWSSRKGLVRFRLEKAQPLRLRLRACTFHDQKIIVLLNDQEAGTLAGKSDFKELELELPAGWVEGTNTLTLTMPDAQSPKSLGEGQDDRILGIGVDWMELVPPS